MYENSDEMVFCGRHRALSAEMREELKALSVTVLKFFDPIEERGTAWMLRVLQLYKKEQEGLLMAARTINARLELSPNILRPTHSKSYGTALRAIMKVKGFFSSRDALIGLGLQITAPQKEKYGMAKSAFEIVRGTLFEPETRYSLEELVERIG